jgi:hypothetical protein
LINFWYFFQIHNSYFFFFFFFRDLFLRHLNWLRFRVPKQWIVYYFWFLWNLILRIYDNSLVETSCVHVERSALKVSCQRIGNDLLLDILSLIFFALCKDRLSYLFQP